MGPCCWKGSGPRSAPPRPDWRHAASAAWTTGKSMSVCATTLSRLVKMFSAVTATISTIWPSLKPASRTALTSASVTFPRSRTTLAANCDGRVRLGVAGRALAVPRDFFRADLRQVQAEIAVRREAVVATVDLRDGQRNPLAGPHVECLGERGAVGREALQAWRDFGRSDDTCSGRHRAAYARPPGSASRLPGRHPGQGSKYGT